MIGCALLVLAVAVAVAGYVLTPSVGDAATRVRALARAHGAGYVDAPVPRRFAEAIVASEDSRFYLEPGIDPIGVARAGWLALTSSGTDGGGSTISQQLAKALYTDGRSGLRRDLEQVALAVKLNLDYGKAQILRMYAASVYFGHGFYGLHEAACGYFGVPPAALSLAQASLLAGLVQAPSAYDPLTHLSLARARQHYVVHRLAADGVVSRHRARRTLRAPLGLRPGHPMSGC
ncbi:MAG TPA: biosynthetic peptidoglycan transglycosylase [Marmoricola sp.]|nr:biosynthetic peptidoglycan transglycosylase [Marmoricola sp.]